VGTERKHRIVRKLDPARSSPSPSANTPPHFTTSIARAADHELGAAARALLDTACRLAR
jgi:hypothetical protein